MKSADTPFAPSWQSVLIVCSDCAKRSSGPKKLKSKALVKTLRQAARSERPRPRVVVSGCLGLCPKRATAVACVGRECGARMVAVKSAEEALEALPGLQKS